MATPKYRFIDLCAGIGGMRIPFSDGECVFTSEIDQQARNTYAKNFCPEDIEFSEFEHQIDRDFSLIGESHPQLIPDHELLLAGFPCQPFSRAGLRKGFEDSRGTLFFSIAAIAKAKKPRVVLLENVRGLISHDGGYTLRRIVETLEDIGYFVPNPALLNARDFGLPQNRIRLFIVAIRADILGASEYKFPRPTSIRDDLQVGSFLDRNVPEKYTISDKLWEGHKNRKIRNRLAGKGFGFQLFKPSDPYIATISARYFKDGAEVLIEQPGRNPRKLTPNEGRRFQGFPEGFVLHESDFQAFKQIGNAVAINVVKSIADTLHPYLRG
jgi:DNA (cytosine-5)-methyltransferase 1